jgi:hypothetical protein
VGAGALALALIAPAAAHAAGRPGVATSPPANVTATSATLTGVVDSNGAATSWAFQYGPTKKYGATTAVTPAAAGRSRIAADVAALAPSTTYHYRLVATNAKGTRRTADATFSTRRQPLAASLAATPPTVLPGGATTLTGQLTGSFSANRTVVLQSNPHPYVQGFRDTANRQVTDAQGRFSFPILSVPVTTQYRVVLVAHPEVASPVLTLGVALKLSTHLSTRRIAGGVAARFRGHVSPFRDGARVRVQRWTKTGWINVAKGRAKHDSAKRSRYDLRVKVRHGGSFRVIAESSGDFVSGAGRTVRVRAR